LCGTELSFVTFAMLSLMAGTHNYNKEIISLVFIVMRNQIDLVTTRWDESKQYASKC